MSVQLNWLDKDNVNLHLSIIPINFNEPKATIEQVDKPNVQALIYFSDDRIWSIQYDGNSRIIYTRIAEDV